MNLKNSFDTAKRKTKENLPAIVTTVAAIGSAAVVVYTARKISIQFDDMFPKPKKCDFSLHLSGREIEKLKSGIPRDAGFMGEVDVFIAARDMLKDDALERVSKTVFKD